MKKYKTFLFMGLAILFSAYAKHSDSNETKIQSETTLSNQINSEKMKLGAFSISLNVQDLEASKVFYEKLGFSVFGGDMAKNYLIMKNENSLIGLFHGMFKDNIITFNPGWDENAKEIESFDDVREIQKRLKDEDIKLESNEIDPNTSGPASIIVKDPDGNMIFIDQHR